MTASTLDSGPLQRHSAFAWSFAVAISVAALSARFELEPLFFAACAFLAAAAVIWAVKKLAGRLTARLPADATAGIATVQASAYLGVLALWLWTAAWLVPVLVNVYPDPASNRAYAEPLGIELGPFLFTVLAACVAVTLVAIAAIHALRSSVPAASATLRAVCIAAPLTCLVPALVPLAYDADLKSVWTGFGADLPSPTLLLLATDTYWGILPLLALALSVLAWAARSNTAVFRWSVAAQLLVLMFCSALLTMFVVAAWMPLFRMCSAV